MSGIKHTIEPGLTLFSSAEIRVALVTIGDIPEDLLSSYVSMVAKHRQVMLANVRSFYKPVGEQKSPFKYFPWRNGCMHFKYYMEDSPEGAPPLSQLHWHRKFLGVIAICHCPNIKDIGKEYQQFEKNLCRAYPDAFTLRFFAFNPTDTQVDQEKHSQFRNLIMFPPGDFDQLESHAEVVMHDFAACLAAELERWMLAASIELFELNTFVDSPEFTGASAFEDLQSKLIKDEEILRKRRYARMQKAQGDVALLAGSPADAFDHYGAAVDLAKASNDILWLAAALEGRTTARIVQEAINRGAIRSPDSSVFALGSMRITRSQQELEAEKGDGDDAGSQADSSSSRSSSGFNGSHFWNTLRQAGLEDEVRVCCSEAKREIKRKGALPLQIELDLKLARFLIGLDAPRVRSEISEMVSSVVDHAGALSLAEDRLMAVVEAAQVIGMVGFARKRTLMLWQAVELSKSMERPDAATLEIAKKALEPAEDVNDVTSEATSLVKRRGIIQAAVPRHWGAVRAGCIEGVLALAIRARQHEEVWDCAAMLLREQYTQLPSNRQNALMETLAAAASHMNSSSKMRPGPGPPPLMYFVRALQPAEQFKPVRLMLGADPNIQKVASGPFIYDPWAEKRRREEEAEGPVHWVAGEMATVEVEVVNPTAVAFKVDRLAVEAENVGDPQQPPRDYITLSTNAWKPMPTSLWVPSESKSTKIQLSGVPTTKGMFVITGCKVTTFGVTWHQAWSARKPTVGSLMAGPRSRPADHYFDAVALPGARVMVVQQLPLLLAQLDRNNMGLAASMDSTLTSPVGSPPHSPSAFGDMRMRGRATRRTPIFKGECIQWLVHVSNIGKLAVLAARLSVQHVAGHRLQRQGAKVKGQAKVLIDSVDVEVCQGVFQELLPLQPGTEAMVPLNIHAGVGTTYNQDENINFEVLLEYVGPQDKVDENLPEQIGRRLKIPVNLRLMPSLQITRIHFLEHYVLSDDAELVEGSATTNSDQCGSNMRRVCLMEVEVMNRSGVHMQLWLSERSADEWCGVTYPDASLKGSFPALMTPPANDQWRVYTRVQLPPRSDDECSSPYHPVGRPLSDASWCAQRLSESYALCWRMGTSTSATKDMEEGISCRGGFIPLAANEIECSIDSTALTMLQPCHISIGFTQLTLIHPGGSREAVNGCLIEGDEGRGGAMQTPDALYGAVMRPGQLIGCSVEVVNHSAAACRLHLSVNAASVGSSCVAGGGAAAYEQEEMVGWDELSVMCSGCTAGLDFHVSAGGRQCHQLTLCCLVEGVVRIFPCDVRCTTVLPDGGEAPVHDNFKMALHSMYLCAKR